jgi:hypothetical protein
MFMPENIINRYVWEQFKTKAPQFYDLYPETTDPSKRVIPFFPAGAANLPPEIVENDLPYITFDKFSRVRTGSYKYFYPIKTDQMRYKIHGGSLFGEPESNSDRYGNTIALTNLITIILDREDAAAEDINQFAKSLYDGYFLPPSLEEDPYKNFRYSFHCINVFQSGYAESQQDVANLMEYRPTRDLIIRYDYHYPQYRENYGIAIGPKTGKKYLLNVDRNPIFLTLESSQNPLQVVESKIHPDDLEEYLENGLENFIIRKES